MTRPFEGTSSHGAADTVRAPVTPLGVYRFQQASLPSLHSASGSRPGPEGSCTLSGQHELEAHLGLNQQLLMGAGFHTSAAHSSEGES